MSSLLNPCSQGQGEPPMFDAFGLPRITTAQLEDFVGLMRRLFRGEVVFGHDGPAGIAAVGLLMQGSSLGQLLAVSAVVMGLSQTVTKERLFEPLRSRLGGKTTWFCEQCQT